MNLDLIFSITTLIVAAISLLIVTRLVFLRFLLHKPNQKLSESFFKELDKKFDLDLIHSSDDIMTLADSFKREHSTSYVITRLIEDYMRYLIKKSSENDENLKKTIIERHIKVGEILKLEKEVMPYSELPREEKRIFQNINLAIKCGEKTEAINALDDLQILITGKLKIYQQSNNINKWSIPLAIIGLVLTIYFGIKSLPGESDKQTNINGNKTQIELPLKNDSIIGQK